MRSPQRVASCACTCPNTLAAYVMHETKKKGVTDCKMKAIDSRGFDMQYREKEGGELMTCRIAFDPPLRGYEEVRPRLVAMKADAEEAIGMIKHPRIDTYVAPDPYYLASIVPLIILLIYTTLGDSTSFAGTIRRYTGGWRTIYAAWIFVVIAHGAESLWTYKLCKRCQMSPLNTLAWSLSTYIVGFPALFTLKRLITQARIASVEKAQ